MKSRSTLSFAVSVWGLLHLLLGVYAHAETLTLTNRLAGSIKAAGGEMWVCGRENGASVFGVRLTPDKQGKEALKGLANVYGVWDLGWTALLTDNSSTAAIGDEEVRLVGEMHGLRRLHLNGTGVSDDGLRHLRNLKNLDTLALTGTRITDAGMAHLAQLSSLRVLNISGTRLTEKGIEDLKACANLRVVYAECNVRIARARVFGRITHLQELYLGGPTVSDADMAALAGITNLRVLYFVGLDTDITDAGLASISTLTQLRELQLTGSKITSEGLFHLQNMPWLHTLNLRWSRVCDAGVTAVLRLRRLRQLGLPRSRLTGTTLGQLWYLPRLRRLDVHGCPLTDACIKDLSGLPLIDLSVAKTKITNEGIQRLREAMPKTRIDVTRGRVAMESHSTAEAESHP